MLGVKHTCQFTVGLVSSLMALGAGVSGLTMAMEGNHWWRTLGVGGCRQGN